MKAKLGISVGLLGALVYFMGLFSGYTVMVLLAGYILLFEENDWLKRTAVKAVGVCVCFSLLSVFIGFIPDLLGLIDDICSVFNGTFYVAVLSNLVTLLRTVISIAQKVLLLVLGIMALKQKTVSLGILDRLMDLPMAIQAQRVAPQPMAPQQPAVPQQGGAKFCVHCGRPMAPEADVCPFCGNKK